MELTLQELPRIHNELFRGVETKEMKKIYNEAKRKAGIPCQTKKKFIANIEKLKKIEQALQKMLSYANHQLLTKAEN